METIKDKYEALVNALILVWSVNADNEDIDVVVYDALESTGDLPEGMTKWWEDDNNNQDNNESPYGQE